MKRWTTEISHAGRLTDRQHHDDPREAVRAWTKLCQQRTKSASGAHLIERVRGAVIKRAYRLDAHELDGSPYPDALRLTMWEPLATGWLGEDVQFLRSELGLTQEAFAEKLGVERVTVARWETGERAVGEMAIRLARLIASQKCP